MAEKTVFLAWWFTPSDRGVNGIFSTEKKALEVLAEAALPIVLPDAPLTQEQHDLIKSMLDRGWKAEAARRFIAFQKQADTSFTYGMWAAPYLLDEPHI